MDLHPTEVPSMLARALGLAARRVLHVLRLRAPRAVHREDARAFLDTEPAVGRALN